MAVIDKKIDVPHLKQKLYNRFVDKKNLLGIIKSDYSISDISKFLRQTESHPFVRKYFYGNPFPKRLIEFGQIYLPHQTDFKKELEILILAIVKFSKEINFFLKIKKEFENSVLLGNYAEANNLLNEAKNQFGYSLWYFENKFIIEELVNGFDGNKKYLNEISTTELSSLTTVFLSFLSIRAELNIDVSNYNNQQTKYFKDFKDDLRNFFNLHLNFLHHFQNLSNLDGIIYFDSMLPIIDRYESLIKICQLITAIEKFQTEKNILPNNLEPLKTKIVDPRLNNLLISYGVQSASFENIEVNKLNVFEAYTLGNYEKSASESLCNLLNEPSELSFLEIYVKSCLYLQKKRIDIANSESISSNLMIWLYHFLSQSSEYNKSMRSANKFISVYQNFKIATQLYYFIEKQIPIIKSQIIEKLKFLNTDISNPFFYQIFLNAPDKVNCLHTEYDIYPLTVLKMFSLIESATTKDDIKLLSELPIPIYRNLLYSAKTLEKVGFIQEAIVIYLKITEEYKNYHFLYTEAIQRLLFCYNEIKDYNSYFKLLVVSRFEDVKLFVMPEEILRRMEAVKFDGVDKTIYLPIFYFLTSKNNHIINLTVRHFLKSYGCKKPSELAKYKDLFDRKYLIFFFKNVCTQEVLKFFTLFRSTEEILNERLNICKILLTLDKENEKAYNEEIGLIAKNIVISEAMLQVDESKIFVDEKGLRNNEFKQIENNFKRYILTLNYSEKTGTIFLDINRFKQFLENLKSSNNDDAEAHKANTLETSVGAIFFKEIFLAIRDEFLFNSKYGLDAYLSTRIRHGTLLGQIRSRFQDYHLITPKDKNQDSYMNNEYWSNKISFDDESQKEQFQIFCSNFSRKIDSLTNQLKNELIQIRTEWKANNGLFDYIYPDSILSDLFINDFQSLREYELFIDRVFFILWQQTSNNLALIRDYILNSIKSQYLEYLNELDNNLKLIFFKANKIQELANSITSCRTHLGWELDKISSWFQIKESNVKDFTIDKAIDTSIEITNRISEEVKIINLEKNIKNSVELKGSSFISYFDLLRIFFDNITKYSGNDTADLKVKIIVEKINEKMIIRIINNLSKDVDEDEIKSIFDQKHNDLNSSNWDMERIKNESGTGFYKAKKILAADLGSENNWFDFKLSKSQVEICISIELTS